VKVSKLPLVLSSAGLTLFLVLLSRFAESQPVPPTASYDIQLRTEYPADTSRSVQRTLIFTKGGKELWQVRAKVPFGKTVLVNETGRCFCELDYPGATEIRVYASDGKKIMSQNGKLLVVSADGNFMACQSQETASSVDPSAVQVINPVTHGAFHFRVDPNFKVKAVAGDGKALLIGRDESNPAGVEYRLVDGRGKMLWGIKGRGLFFGLEKGGKWALFYRSKQKAMEFIDFQTGKWLDEMPRWKFDALHNPPPSPKGPPKTGAALRQG
jgi:hypothetical protein